MESGFLTPILHFLLKKNMESGFLTPILHFLLKKNMESGFLTPILHFLLKKNMELGFLTPILHFLLKKNMESVFFNPILHFLLLRFSKLCEIIILRRCRSAAENREFSEVYHLTFAKVAYIEIFFYNNKFENRKHIILK